MRLIDCLQVMFYLRLERLPGKVCDLGNRLRSLFPSLATLTPSEVVTEHNIPRIECTFFFDRDTIKSKTDLTTILKTYLSAN